MERKNQNDYLDSLLYAASKGAGKSDIAEYNSGEDSAELGFTARDIIGDPGKKDGSRKSVRISFRRRIAIAIAAALIVSLLAFGVVATRKSESAGIKTEYVVIKDIHPDKALSVSYDIKDGMWLGSQPKLKIPEVLDEKYIRLSNYYLGGSFVAVTYFDGTCELPYKFTYSVQPLSDNPYKEFPKDSKLIEVLVNGKYHGALVVYTGEDGTFSTVMWNDGKLAYSISAQAESDAVVKIAQSIYE
jgi:hypothetical protein